MYCTQCSLFCMSLAYVYRTNTEPARTIYDTKFGVSVWGTSLSVQRFENFSESDPNDSRLYLLVKIEERVREVSKMTLLSSYDLDARPCRQEPAWGSDQPPLVLWSCILTCHLLKFSCFLYFVHFACLCFVSNPALTPGLRPGPVLTSLYCFSFSLYNIAWSQKRLM